MVLYHWIHILMLTYLLILSLLIGEPENQEEYIQKHLFKAKILEILTGIPTSLQLAQSLVETGGGKSYIAKHSNNHFGIKYFPNAISYTNTFFIDRRQVKWRSYINTWHSFIDHALFLSHHYPQLRYQSVTTCNQLKGYGGKANYWSYINSLIHRKKLHQYDTNWNRSSIQR